MSKWRGTGGPRAGPHRGPGGRVTPTPYCPAIPRSARRRSTRKPPRWCAGNGYLVVWEDSRTNYNNILDGAAPQGGDEGGQQLKDIYAARLDAAGQLMDPTPIVVAQAPWSQTRPQVAWNGQNWLVVWNTERVADFTTTT